MLGPMQQHTLNKDAYVNNDVSELNREFIYEQKFRREKGIESELKSVQQQRFERAAAFNGEEVEDLLESIKDYTKVTDETHRFGREFTDRKRFGVSQTEFDSKPREKQVRSITDFAGSASNEDLSEREDEDIYRHYMEQMRREK